jgi:hypothetical protein
MKRAQMPQQMVVILPVQESGTRMAIPLAALLLDFHLVLMSAIR